MLNRNHKVKYTPVPIEEVNKTVYEESIIKSKKMWLIIVLIFVYFGQTCSQETLTRLFSRKSDSSQNKRNISISGDNILLNGKRVHILSGEIHYFRIPWQYWEDRLLKLKAAGLNTVSTYVEWSFHEPEELEYKFGGDNNISQFIRTAGDLGLFVLLRPGPYICAERDLGGLPYWLLYKYPSAKLRSLDKGFMLATRFWMRKLFLQISPYLFGNGGPIIMVQVENEYGSTTDSFSRKYMRRVRDIIKNHVDDNALLYTADGDGFYHSGSVEGALPTVTMLPNGDNIAETLEELYTNTKGQPLMISEFYTGWFTEWGSSFSPTVYSKTIIKVLTQLLEYNRTVHVNFYMFCGGTNFEGYSGAVERQYTYVPVATTYDFDAPISESGKMTYKYNALRNFLEKYIPQLSSISIPENPLYADYGKVVLQPCLNMLSDKGRRVMGQRHGDILGDTLPPLEQLRQRFGFVLYETTVNTSAMTSAVVLEIPAPRDRVYVFLDSVLCGVISRMTNETKVTIYPVVMESALLSLLVEDQGRLSHKGMSTDFKGISSPIIWNNTVLNGYWTVRGFPLTMKKKSCELFNNTYNYRTTLKRGPLLYTGTFVIPRGDKPLDTFFFPTGWGKGYIWINGHNLGRYWPTVGPQITLFVPGVWLRVEPARNVVHLLELERAPQNLTVEFINYPIIY